MPTVVRFLLCFAALAAFAAVMGGALTAHMPARFFAEGGRDMARQAIQMQMWHALAIIGVSVLMIQQGCRALVSIAGCPPWAPPGRDGYPRTRSAPRRW